MSTFILISNINLNTFNALIYKFEDYNGEVVTEENITNIIPNLNNQETAIEVAELLFNLAGVSRIEILDKSNVLILEVVKVDSDMPNL